MHAFEFQHSPQTLAEGVAEYYQVNPDLVKGRSASREAQEFFRCHDAAHDIWAAAGTPNAVFRVTGKALLDMTRGVLMSVK